MKSLEPISWFDVPVLEYLCIEGFENNTLGIFRKWFLPNLKSFEICKDIKSGRVDLKDISRSMIVEKGRKEKTSINIKSGEYSKIPNNYGQEDTRLLPRWNRKNDKWSKENFKSYSSSREVQYDCELKLFGQCFFFDPVEPCTVTIIMPNTESTISYKSESKF